MKDTIYRIQQLPSAQRGVVSVDPDHKLLEAISLMLLNDYSQVPVMSSDNRRVYGLISWKTLGVKRHFAKEDDLVKDYMTEKISVIKDSENFLKAVRIILEDEYVLIKNRKNIITGIVTLFDIGEQFLTHSEPFIEIEQIERCLRGMINESFTSEELAEVKNGADSTRTVESSSDLTFGEYIRLLENKTRWEKFGLNISRSKFIEKLREINQIRNNVMHFKIDGLADSDRRLLRSVGNFLQTYPEDQKRSSKV